jgi:predicted metal-dependent hydrolase
MPVIKDPEFGKITIRRSANASQVKLRVASDGKLRASLPLYAPLFLVKRLVKSSRAEIRDLLKRSDSGTKYEPGMEVGKSHTLIVKPTATTKVTRSKNQIIVHLAEQDSLDDPEVVRLIKDMVIKVLRREAKGFLPRRVKYIADKYGFEYQTIRFSHASSRWGSCSSKGTLSLNIALMKLPFELIDYVLVHELAHTKQMNHSPEFWAIVEAILPDYKELRKVIKTQTPSV